MKFKIIKKYGGHESYEFKLVLYRRQYFLWDYMALELFYKGGNETEDELIRKLIQSAKEIESKRDFEFAIIDKETNLRVGWTGIYDINRINKNG